MPGPARASSRSTGPSASTPATRREWSARSSASRMPGPRERGRDRRAEELEERGDLAVGLEADLSDLRRAEAAEARARLVDREPRRAAGVDVDRGAQRRIQQDRGVV